jgi:hypothetical protein
MMSILLLIAGTLLLIGSGSRSPRLAPQPIRTTRKR